MNSLPAPKTVVITGASAGVGRATALAFAHQGARIGLIARQRERLDAVRQEIENLGGQALILPLDLTDADRVEAAAAEVEAHFGPIDIWVNSAMVTIFSYFWDITPEEFRRVTDVTYHGYVYATQAALRRMRARNRGVIVQVGSALAYRSIPLQSAYCGAKHAIVGFTDSIRSELLHEGSAVRITAVHLPAINTPQFDWARNRMPQRPQPVPPIYQPEVAADAIVWAAYHPRREWYLGFSTLKAIEGQKLAPGYADQYLADNGITGQQAAEAAIHNSPDNLFKPVAGDFGAHGRFDDLARSRSLQLSLSKHRRSIGFAALGLLLGASGVLLGNRKK